MRDRRHATCLALLARIAGLAAALGALLLACGCTGFHYLVQAGLGQIELSMAAESLDDAIANPRTPVRTRALLRQVPAIKRFGEQHGLKPTDNYTTYADLDRPAAVWVVAASEPLRFQSKTWSFPIVGSVPYLGWFNRDDADEFAADLRAEGWDVDVRGADAYSTLGWFEDPVLSTMIPDGDEALGDLANVVLHESLHATLYIPGQTRLNESLANFVGDELATRYLDAHTGPESREKRAYLEERERREQRRRALHEAYAALEALYASPLSDAEKLRQKRVMLSALEAHVRARRHINNATLSGFRFYNSGGDALPALLQACGSDWPRFINALKQLKDYRFDKPLVDVDDLVRPLLRSGCRRLG